MSRLWGSVTPIRKGVATRCESLWPKTFACDRERKLVSRIFVSWNQLDGWLGPTACVVLRSRVTQPQLRLWPELPSKPDAIAQHRGNRRCSR